MIVDLNTRDGYMIASAMRGPDVQTYYAQMLKSIFTQRIRALAGHEFSGNTRTTPALSRAQVKFLSVEMVDFLRSPKLNEDGWLYHYLSHVKVALYCIKDQLPDLASDELRDLICLAYNLMMCAVTADPTPFTERAQDVYWSATQLVELSDRQ